MVLSKARVFVRSVHLVLPVPIPLSFSLRPVLLDTFVRVVWRCPMESNVQVEPIFLMNTESLKMSASHALLASTVNFLDRLTQLDHVLQDSCAEVEPNFLHQMIQVIHITGLVLLGLTVKKEQQMAQSAPKEHSGHILVLKHVMTVCLALEGSTVISPGCLLQPITVTQVTTVLQKKTFAMQSQAAFCVQPAISVQRALPIHLAVARGHIKVVNNKYHVMPAHKASTASSTPLTQ